MKRESLIQFNDDLALTYSVFQDKRIIIYIEKPNEDRSDKKSAEYLYPEKTYNSVVGFSEDELLEMIDRVEKGCELVLEWEKT